MTKFEKDTGLVPIGDGRYRGEVSGDWSIVRGANGGHLAAILLRGMRASVDDGTREPRSLTVHFARVPQNDEIVVETTLERTGRTVSNVSARIVQDGKLIVLGLGVFGTEREGPDFSDISMPDVADPDTIEAVADRPDFPFGRQFDIRWAIGPPPEGRSERAEIAVWIRLREPHRVDHVVATQLLDAFAPAVFAKLGQGGGGAGVPTIDMTYHFRESLPADDEPGEWHLGVFRTSTSRGGFIEEDGWLWNRRGTLLAQSRQLALLMNG